MKRERRVEARGRDGEAGARRWSRLARRLLGAVAVLVAISSAGCTPFQQVMATRPGEAFVLTEQDVLHCVAAGQPDAATSVTCTRLRQE